MNLKTAANILDKNGDYKSADIVDDLLIKTAASPLKPGILQPATKPISTLTGCLMLNNYSYPSRAENVNLVIFCCC